MSDTIIVTIVGARVACKDGSKDTWREVAGWAAGQLKAQFDEQVRVKYFDLFDPGCPRLPAGMQLPVVMVNEKVLSNGDKISIPLIRREIDTLLEKNNY